MIINPCTLMRMQTLIERMREYMWNRIWKNSGDREPNYSVATYVEWTANPGSEKDRFAQFCWFLASTAGNYAVDVAGSWFPYCAKSNDVNDTVNSAYGMAMTAEEFEHLKQAYYHLNQETCKEVVKTYEGPCRSRFTTNADHGHPNADHGRLRHVRREHPDQVEPVARDA